MEDNNNMVSATETAENQDLKVQDTQNNQTSQEKEVKTEKTFTRDELNKILATEKAKIRQELEKEAEEQRNEAEKLAKMNAEQKAQYEKEQLQKELDLYKKRESARTLKDETINIFNEKDIPMGYLDVIDFDNTNAEKVQTIIDKIQILRNKDRESILNQAYKQKTPKQVANTTSKEEDDPFLKGFNSI